jgi:S-adenosylmethionine:tRNA ribosyltransferase-isomerase
MSAQENAGAAGGLRLSQFDYELPAARVAQEPARPRDSSRLMVLRRAGGAVAHHLFHELPDLLSPGDLVVLNDARVIPAAFTARRATGARVEGVFLRVLDGGLWEVLLSGRGRLKVGETIALVGPARVPPAVSPDVPRTGGKRERRASPEPLRQGAACEIVLAARGAGGVWHVRPPQGVEAMALLARVGRTPLPPYIRRGGAADGRAKADVEDYQTVYARRRGAVAAPTAGLHFTPGVLGRLDARGIERTFVTLHVGLGTFQPVRAERVADHRMHEEYAEIPAEATDRINRALAGGRRIVAVGTTTVRALESAAGTGAVQAGGRWTRLFIYPPYRFRVVGAMVTNFHLPRTTLLMMVSAFAGRERILAAYREAVRAGYRFYSYGDAMLII